MFCLSFSWALIYNPSISFPIFLGRWIANSLDFNKDYEASVFETTIRLCYKVYVVELSCSLLTWTVMGYDIMWF
jgi:hypothetical protein